MKNKKTKIKIPTKNKYIYIMAIALVLISLIIVVVINVKNFKEEYMVLFGTIENIETTSAYVIKEEKVINVDNSKILIPVVPEGYRVSKGDIIETYKSKKYEDYEKHLKIMDTEILELMKDLPVVYSGEVDTIDNIIYKYIIEAVNETSYIKMQEYKNNINHQIEKRAEIIGKLSPDGAAVKKIIKKRNDYENRAKKSNNNVLATMPGIVSYKTDGLEKKIKLKNIDHLTINDLKTQIKNLKMSNSSIKIVNNYLAYIITQVTDENKEYMVLGRNYKLNLLGDIAYEFKANLYNIKENKLRI